nr:MAG TPA: hypothetical protein [Caudoviricetes sp.]
MNGRDVLPAVHLYSHIHHYVMAVVPNISRRT